MSIRIINTDTSVTKNWIGQVVYWLVAALLMFFVFSNRNYDLQIRFVLVSLLIAMSYFTTLTVNNYLIPQLFFKGKTFRFIYALFAVFILTLWLITFIIILILLYSTKNLPDAVIPAREDLIILITGNYLIVILAAVIHFIRESYRKLIEKNDLEKQKQKTEFKLKEVHLKLLQGQIHPHFIFNMLNNIYGLVKENTEKSRNVIIKLSDLLDYMLYECDNEQVELNKEIEFIKNYIELERVRHDDDFDVKTEFPKNANSLKIAPLILFPFVENAFKHGFRNTSENYIYMKVEVSGTQLIFTIENNHSTAQPDKFLNQESNGIGLKNIRERLNLIYKDKHKLYIHSDESTYKIHLELNLT